MIHKYPLKWHEQKKKKVQMARNTDKQMSWMQNNEMLLYAKQFSNNKDCYHYQPFHLNGIKHVIIQNCDAKLKLELV